MPSWDEIWQTALLGNSVAQWVLATVAFAVTFTVLPLARGYVSAQRRKRADEGRALPLAVEVFSLLVSRTSKLFLFFVAVEFALTQLTLPRNIEATVRTLTIVVFWLQMGLWGMAAVRLAIDQRARRGRLPDPALASSIDLLTFIAGLAIWTMVFLMALDNLGVQIRPVLAGLGIGGIAVALAVQTVLGDLLASMSIALDKPFAVGDALQVDEFNGTVEHIGVKSTRLRSLSGEQIIISNADILKSRVRNNGRMRERRAVFTFNVVYSTSPEKLRAIPGVVREIIESQPHTRFGRCHFLAYGDWALRFEVVYTVTVADYDVYADVQQAINLAIFERFASMGVEFAFPSRPFDPAAQSAGT